MKKIDKLKSAGEIIEIQERELLSELKLIQTESALTRAKIEELKSFSTQAKNNSLNKLINSNHLATTVSFYNKLDVGIAQLQERAGELDKQYKFASEKYKKISSTRLSINRLVDKYQLIENKQLESFEQRQIEEFINYKYQS